MGPNQQRTSASGIDAKMGGNPERMLLALALVWMVTVVDADVVPGERTGTEKLQYAPAGNPEQLKETVS